MRTPNGQFPEYHTSADNLDFVRPESLEDSLRTVLEIIQVLEDDGVYMNLSPKCEPQLGRRGLYDSKGGVSPPDLQMAMLWVLNFSDGRHSLIDIAERAGISFAKIHRAALALKDAGLLGVVQGSSSDVSRGDVISPLRRPQTLSVSRA
jgi:aminopeptidase-like protein